MASGLVSHPTEYGIVTQAAPLMVLLRGATQPAPARQVSSYTATIGDTVAVVSYRKGHLVLGAEPPMPPGWVVPTLDSPWVAANSTVVAYQLQGNQVVWKGEISGASSGNLYTMPPGLWPLQTVQLTVASGGTLSPSAVVITSAGVVSVLAATGATDVSLDQVRWLIS